MKKAQKEKIVKGAEIGGAITAALLAASASAYLLADKKNQAKMKSWARKARTEVAKKAKTAKRLGKAQYHAIVDKAVKRYGSLEEVNTRDLVAAGRELKAQWDAIQQNARKLARQKSASKKTTARRRTATRKASSKKTVRKAK